MSWFVTHAVAPQAPDSSVSWAGLDGPGHCTASDSSVTNRGGTGVSNAPPNMGCPPMYSPAYMTPNQLPSGSQFQ